MKKNENGFSALVILILIVIVGLIGTAGWWVFDRQSSQTTNTTTKAAITESEQTAKKSVSPAATPGGLLAGDFGEKGNYGTFQAEGYAKVLKELYDTSADCGMSNPGVECPKIDGVFFIVTKTPNTKVLSYIKQDYANHPDNSIVMGCPANGTINYSNMSDVASKSYLISKEDTTKILASTADKPVRLEIKKDQQSFGKDAPICYSDFTTYKVLN